MRPRGNGADGVAALDGARTIRVGGAGDEGNLVSGNAGDGVHVGGTDVTPTRDVTIVGNRIGTDIDGVSALGNGAGGIRIDEAQATLVGDGPEGSGNLVSGHAGESGVLVVDAVDTLVGGAGAGLGNLIPANLEDGIVVLGATSVGTRILGGTTVGAANAIRTNAGAGIAVTGAGSAGNALLPNVIGGNGGLGIELGELGELGIDANDALDTDPGPNELVTVGDGARRSAAAGVVVRIDDVREAPSVQAASFATVAGHIDPVGTLEVLVPDVGDVLVFEVLSTGVVPETAIGVDLGGVMRVIDATPGVSALEVRVVDAAAASATGTLTVSVASIDAEPAPVESEPEAPMPEEMPVVEPEPAGALPIGEGAPVSTC